MYLARINNISTRNTCIPEPLEARGGGGGGGKKSEGGGGGGRGGGGADKGGGREGGERIGMQCVN